MRVFIAVDIGDDIKRSLAALAERLGAAADIHKGDVKWIDVDNMHLTLRFLGEIGDRDVIDVCGAVERVAGLHGSFELEVLSVGSFGGKSARVIWAGIGDGIDSLRGLTRDIEKGLNEIGIISEDKKFSPHLTLCRVKKSTAGVRLGAAIGEFSEFNGGFTEVGSVIVYQSQLGRAGPVYTKLGEFKLGKV